MRRILRENAACALIAGGGCAVMAWLGLYGFAWNDYEVEARSAFDAVAHGHLLRFLQLAPAYGGSLVERAPFALLPGLWGGGQLAIYRMVAVPCLLAMAAFAVWLCARMRAEHRSKLARALALGVCVANPMTLDALELGHPEELMGACLCVTAVILASRNRPLWAGALLGLAVANKEWALLAAAPVLLALPAHQGDTGETSRLVVRRPVICCAATACVVTVAILAPLVLASAGGFVSSARGAAVAGGALFQPWQVWWFLGHHGALVHGMFGTPLYGYRTGPAWTSAISHPLIIAVGLGLGAALWLHRRRAHRVVGERDAMLLLAVVLLLRCVLDTWDTGYYMLPFVLALLAWEVRGRDRPPLLVLLCVVLPWYGLQELSAHDLSPDAQAALFLTWTLPLATWLGCRLFAPPRSAAAEVETPGRSAAPHETTVSVLGRLVSTS
jgi:hypothetical protein